MKSLVTLLILTNTAMSIAQGYDTIQPVIEQQRMPLGYYVQRVTPDRYIFTKQKDSLALEITKDLEEFITLTIEYLDQSYFIQDDCRGSSSNCMEWNEIIDSNGVLILHVKDEELTLGNTKKVQGLKIKNEASQAVSLRFELKDQFFLNLCDVELSPNSIAFKTPIKNLFRGKFICNYQKNTQKPNCAPVLDSRFNIAFSPPCNVASGPALSSRYNVVYDLRGNPEPLTYLKTKRKNGFEYYKIIKGPLRPKAYSELIVSVIAPKDTVFLVATSSTQHFMEHEGDFVKAAAPPEPEEDMTVQPDKVEKENRKTDSLKAEIQTREKLLGLEGDLREFNTLYPTIDLIESIYFQELYCLQQNISRIFQIPVAESGNELHQFLSQYLRKQRIEQTYFEALCSTINRIKNEYDIAVNKKAHYFIRSQSVMVENTDEFRLQLEGKNMNIALDRTFNVRGGFKIDFSTGIFFTGHQSGNFIVSTQNFRYKDSRDSILPNGMDTTLLLGQIRDTVINVIRRNSNITFGTGAYLHFYRRTGGWLDFGGSAGIILNNNAQVQVLLGGSLMMKTGRNRIAFVGGLAVGRETVLSKEDEQYFLDNTKSLLDSRRALPRTFAGTNPTTVERWKPSWFAGITFNFATKTVAKSD